VQLILLLVTAALELQIQLLAHRLHTLVAVVVVLKGKPLVQAKAAGVMEQTEIPLLLPVLPTRVAAGVEVDMLVALAVRVAQAAQE
jgi:molybdenum cofactor biosynthesis enzyme